MAVSGYQAGKEVAAAPTGSASMELNRKPEVGRAGSRNETRSIEAPERTGCDWTSDVVFTFDDLRQRACLECVHGSGRRVRLGAISLAFLLGDSMQAALRCGKSGSVLNLLQAGFRWPGRLVRGGT